MHPPAHEVYSLGQKIYGADYPEARVSVYHPGMKKPERNPKGEPNIEALDASRDRSTDAAKAHSVLQTQSVSQKGSASLLTPKAWHWLLLIWALSYYLGQPPAHLPALGWLSCFAFAGLVIGSGDLTRRQYVAAWLASCMVWLALLQGIRLAFWPLTFGWIALALYLAVYLPASLAMAKGLQQRLGFSAPISCAVAWTAGEVLRAYVVTGFAGCMLVHSQTPWPSVLQIASHLGGYGVGFLMILSAGWLMAFGVALRTPERLPFWPGLGRNAIAAVVMLWLSSSISGVRVRNAYLEGLEPIKPLGHFLLVQDNMPTQFDATPELIEQGWNRYASTMRSALQKIPPDQPIDVVVWPESVFTGSAPYTLWDRGPEVPEELGIDRPRLENVEERLQEIHAEKLKRFAMIFGDRGLPKLLMGGDVMTIRKGRMERFNSALWIDPVNSDTDFYAKQHLVMFGEYIPVVSWFPAMMKAIGLGVLSSGQEPKAWRLDSGNRIAPSICFETVVPHLIQSQIQQLTQAGSSPDLLINLSNDGWFRGSSVLDHHLNSARVTAVENRTPTLVCANTGLTAWIDGDGRVIEQLPRLTGGWLLAKPWPDGRVGLWRWWGDLPARCIAVLGLIPFSLCVVDRIRNRITVKRS